ncbi:MAG TPA: aminotransferase class I/II-fold pyridoxal phosphate-dependent enzyme [Bacillota bacterium]|jgi:8-amino-7-oxononanoate synthase/acyl carrier protein|nr:aminotransferase class I/II-fold pyridoxal phosphate-dependent enzyme [Fastidiosipila sp.]HPX93386.1 aminotransferase class I/II-fold pyridoxal phosphate-dependent enzyme [Bacillota bacterium]HQB80476.1 aminotransferase class I/II-fold pyridoxal phosphate-dependent enzyme [Bacillota bacterium]
MKFFEYLEQLEEVPGYRGLFRLVERLGQGTAFEIHTSNGLMEISYDEYLGLIDETAKRMTDYFRSGGMQKAIEEKERSLDKDDPGRRGWVGIQMQNGPGFGICYWAAMASGHPVVLIDVRASDPLTDTLAAETGIIALIADEAAERTTPYPVIPALALMPDWRDAGVRQRYARGGKNELAAPASELDGWGGHICLCTSGTTGISRCYVHDDIGITEQYGILKKLLASTDRFAREGVKEKAVAFIPWHHVFGFIVCFLFPQVFGNTMVIPAKPSPEAIVQACKESRVTQFVAIPAVWNGVAQLVKKRFVEMSGTSPEDFDKMIELSLSYQEAGVDLPMPVAGMLQMIREQLVGNELYIAVSGGGYILPETLRILNGLGYYLVNGYGMTEIGIYSVVNTEVLADRLDGNVGAPLFDDSLRMVPLGDEQRDRDDPCERGELTVRSNVVFCGTLRGGIFHARDRKEWFHTGDIGRFCGDRIFLDGRVKDIILKASGENLYPDELEGAFATVPGLQKYVIFGLPEGLYDRIAMLVEPVEGADPEVLAEAVAEINLTMPLDQQIERFFVSKKPLDLSASAKVRRGPVAEAVASGDWPLTEYPLAARKKAAEAVAPSETEIRASSYCTPEIAADPAFFEVRKTVQSLIAELLDLPFDQVEPSSYFSQDLGGDSLQSISLLTHAEVEFGLAIDERLFDRDLTVNDIAALVFRRIHGEFADGRAADTSEPDRQVTRIKTFEETPEYKAFAERRDSLTAALEMFGNPYFIAQDSSLRDVSYIGGRKMLNFASYNYVGLSGDPEVNQAAIEAVKQYGTSASGSRLIAGEKTVHQDLEKALAAWKGTEDALVLVGGHSTNVTFVGNFCGERDLILYDVLSHNSITEGIRMAQADARPFPHNDFQALEQLLKNRRDRYEKVLIVIEGAYSMDGDVAPVPEFVRIKKTYDCFLMVDEAHSMLVLGKTGRGVDEHFGIDPKDIDIHMGTLSKGFGTCGGYLAGSRNLIEYLRYNLPGFVFSVGISPPLAAAVLKGIEIMERDSSRVDRLRRNIKIFLDEAHRYGFDTCLAEETAVTPIMIGSDEIAFMLSKQLEDEGIIVPPAVFPAVARGQARLRFCMTSEHTEEQILSALATLHRLASRYPGLLAH